MIRRLTPRAAVVLAAWAALAAGCGGDKAKTAAVRGKVTYKGGAVPTGTVTFMPDPAGPPATGDIQPDGTFTLTTYSKGDGAVLGKHKVIIVAMQDQGNRLPEEKSPLPPPIVPVKYTSPATTTLTATVEDKENTITFDLKDG
jgi:hypothetical protein